MMLPAVLFALAFLTALLAMMLHGRYEELTMPCRVFYCILFIEGLLIHSVLIYMLYNMPK